MFAHLDEAGLPGACLELEITESLLMVDEAAAALAVRAVRELGVHVAIDDFGTGYSSLAYLKHFPIEALKIDRSFVADLGRDSNDAAICAAIIAMGRQLGLKIVAEGVETREQLEFLGTHGCTLAQGFYIAGRSRQRRWPNYCASARTSPEVSRRLPREWHRRAAGGLRSRDAAEGGQEVNGDIPRFLANGDGRHSGVSRIQGAISAAAIDHDDFDLVCESRPKYGSIRSVPVC